MSQLDIKDLHVAIGDKPIVNGVSLSIRQGEVHALMGPNGTGKSTLAKAIAGHPDYTITSGDVLIDGRSHSRPWSPTNARVPGSSSPFNTRAKSRA